MRDPSGQNDLGGTASAASSFERKLDRIFSSYKAAPFTVRFWDDSVWSQLVHTEAHFELWLRNSEALRVLLVYSDEISLTQAFVDGDLYINGDLVQALRAWPFIRECAEGVFRIDRVLLRRFRQSMANSLVRLNQYGVKHSKSRDLALTARPFAQSPAFYQLFLGPQLWYGPGRFEGLDDSWSSAQDRRLDEICRRLGLSSGSRFLDIDCGWGELVITAAKRFRAKSFGITPSSAQLAYAHRRIAEADLGDRCDADQRDYRDLDILRLTFDSVVAIGVPQHLGFQNVSSFFAAVYRTIVPGGVLLTESLVRTARKQTAVESLADQFVFPDRELVSTAVITEAAQAVGFELSNKEDLRTDYALTFRKWLEALIQRESEAVTASGKHTVRAWKIYFAAITAALEDDLLSGCELIFRKPQGQESQK